MLEELLGQLLPAEQALSLLEPAVLDRDFARQAYDERKAAVGRLDGQMARGVWRSRAVAAGVAGAKNDRLLLRMSRAYVDAHKGRCDLDIEYHPLLPSGRNLSLDDVAAALAFIAAARPAGEPELWFGALQDEASAYLHQLRGDVYLAQALAGFNRLDAELLAQLDPGDPYASRNILIHAAAVALFSEQRLPWRVEAAYRRFLATLGDDPFAGWHSRADADPAYYEATRDAYYSLVLDALAALELCNPSDRREIDRLAAEQPPPDFAPALGMYEPDVVALPDLPPSVFAAAADALGRVGAALKPAAPGAGLRRAARPRAVCAGWEAFARRGLRDFRALARILGRTGADGEALGIVVQALRGEARYRMGRYEDAYLDLLAAEEGARAALGRRSGDAATWAESERDGVARFAQKAGNALAAIGDEERAGEAYRRAAALASGPLAVAGNFVNEGNRNFLRNSVVGGQGYITLDAEARQAFVLRGPERLKAAIAGQHVDALSRAEESYWAALDALAGVEPGSQGAQSLTATCHIDLGNVAWAWGQTLVAEGAAALGELLPGKAFASKMVGGDSSPQACYEAAVAGYEAALDGLGAGEAGGQEAGSLPPDALPLVITALSSLSEMRYLVARETLRGGGTAAQLPLPPAETGSPAHVSLTWGLDEAARCLGLIGQADAALYPDLVWRTHYNLARMHRLLSDAGKAAAHFDRAIDTVERLRGAVRMDALQATFLHDKHDVYEGYLDLLLAQDPAPMPRIFELFERSRARAFLSLLQAAGVKAGLPKALRSEAEDLLAQVSACNEAIQAAVAADCPEDAQTLLSEQRRLALRWQDVQSKMAARGRRGSPVPPIARLADFQAALAPDQAYLGLLLGDEASCALLVDGASARAVRLPPRRALELLALPVLTYATWSNAETGAAFRAANAALTEALFGPLEDAVGGLASYLRGKHLLVSPDGILCYLPFDLLLADLPGLAALPETADYPDFAPFYLLSLADVTYVPSASGWLELSRRKREPARAALMAVYNVLYDTPEPPLWAVEQQIMLKLGAVTSGPDIRRLVEDVKKAWGEDAAIVRLRGQTDDGASEEAASQSTERNFLRVAPDAGARVLLFHGHGIYNDRYPSLSGLVFNLQTEPGRDKRAAIPAAEDGFLRVEELFELELPGAELAFLAACQTALGAYRRGEGLSALVRGFLHRGSPAVVATLWEVRADVTALILRAFFRLLSEQPHADRARLFSQAKRKAMPIPSGLYLPYFWAPFVVWGYTAPPDC